MSCTSVSSTLFHSTSNARSSAATAIAFLRQCRVATQNSHPRATASISTSSHRLTRSPAKEKFNTPISRPHSGPTVPRIPPAPPIHGRHFSSSHHHLASETTVLQNPRTDDDGNEMRITISPRAASRLSQITTSDSSSPQHLRVTVTSGGCHGFQYLMSLEPSTKVDAEEDTIFESSPDSESQKIPARVVMDEPSLELLRDSTIDYTTELIGSQFKIVGNPRAKSSCGCGTSFDID